VIKRIKREDKLINLHGEYTAVAKLWNSLRGNVVSFQGMHMYLVVRIGGLNNSYVSKNGKQAR